MDFVLFECTLKWYSSTGWDGAPKSDGSGVVGGGGGQVWCGYTLCDAGPRLGRRTAVGQVAFG
jgi:hypothetical protein